MTFDFQTLLLYYPVFLFALTIHEVAHALTANWGGDLTATNQNRLSLNPLVHMEVWGTVVIPLLTMLSGYGIFGWARPVPVNERFFRDRTWNVVVSLAGPFSNLLLAIFGTLFLSLVWGVMMVGHSHGWWVVGDKLGESFAAFTTMYVRLNWLLFVFNLIPIPPLDGSHVLYHCFIRGRGRLYAAWDVLSQWGFVLLLVLMRIPAFGLLFGLAVEIPTQLTHFILWIPVAPLPGAGFL